MILLSIWLASYVIIVGLIAADAIHIRRSSRRPPRRRIRDRRTERMSPSPITYRFQARDDELAAECLIASLKSEVRHG